MSTAPLVTPEAVPLELEPAGLGSRFLALLLDWAIQAVVATALVLGLLAAASGEGAGVAQALIVLLLFLVLFGYPAASETLFRGRTVGKLALGLRVVTTEGAPVRFRHAAIRAALGMVDFFLTAGAGAVLSVLFTRNNQRLGDLVAGTIVLRERTGLAAPLAVTFVVPPDLEGYAASLDASAVRAEDYGAVRAFLLRAADLQPRVRYDLAVRLATPLLARLQTRPPAGVPPEAFLACVAAAYQHRSAAGQYPPPPPAVAPAPGAQAPIPTGPADRSPFAPPDEPDPPAPAPDGGFAPMS